MKSNKSAAAPADNLLEREKQKGSKKNKKKETQSKIKLEANGDSFQLLRLEQLFFLRYNTNFDIPIMTIKEKSILAGAKVERNYRF